MFVALSLLLAAACFLPAAAKLLSHPKMQASAGHFGIPWRAYCLRAVARNGLRTPMPANLRD